MLTYREDHHQLIPLQQSDIPLFLIIMHDSVKTYQDYHKDKEYSHDLLIRIFLSLHLVQFEHHLHSIEMIH